MKKIVTLFVAAILALPVAGRSQNDINIITANSDVFISSGGRLVLSSPTTNRGMNRWAYLNFAVGKEEVYNFDDSTAVLGPPAVDSTSANRKADFVLRHVTSPAKGTSGSNPAGSSVQHIMTVYIWKNLKGILVAYRLRNSGAAPLNGKISFELYPRIDQSYFDHRLRWSATDSIVYFFRGTLPHFLGAKFLSGTATGVRLSAGSDFYVSGPFAENQPDSIRFNAANYTSFDSSVDSPTGTRSMIHLNGPALTLNPGDSTAAYYYALAYDVSEAGMLQAIKEVQTKYRESFLTAVASHDELVPAGFSLQQNYPNPFNPATQIRFTLARTANVQLTIYDASGREVNRLLNGLRPAGEHVVTFEARGLTSGVYFYKLRTEKFTATRKMLLMR